MKKNPEQVKVLLSRDFPEIASTLLNNAGFIIESWDQERPMTPTELAEKAKDTNALLCGGTDTIDASLLKQCTQLEIISQFAVGYDNINILEASGLGIPVCNTPNAMSDATADIAFGLMITASRKMFYMHKMIAKGEWTYFRPKGFLGIELKKKTLGVFGMGRIGTEMAKRCKGAYDMNIIYHNRKSNPQAEQLLGAKHVSFDELLTQSDVISIHSVLSEETKGIFNRSAFKKMKSSSIFINTSRGGLHNEEDLIEALQNKTIWGAGLDVTNPEPMRKDSPLLDMENVSILPHIGSATIEARTEMARLAAQNIIGYYRNGVLMNNVNPEFVKYLN